MLLFNCWKHVALEKDASICGLLCRHHFCEGDNYLRFNVVNGTFSQNGQKNNTVVL